MCSVDDDRQAALDVARLMVTQYLGQQPHIMKASGVPQALLDEIGEVLTWPATHDEVVAASKLVPDDIVQMITASGTPDEVAGQGRRVRRHRLHLPDPLPARPRRRRDDRHVRPVTIADGQLPGSRRVPGSKRLPTEPGTAARSQAPNGPWVNERDRTVCALL